MPAKPDDTQKPDPEQAKLDAEAAAKAALAEKEAQELAEAEAAAKAALAEKEAQELAEAEAAAQRAQDKAEDHGEPRAARCPICHERMEKYTGGAINPHKVGTYFCPNDGRMKIEHGKIVS